MATELAPAPESGAGALSLTLLLGADGEIVDVHVGKITATHHCVLHADQEILPILFRGKIQRNLGSAHRLEDMVDEGPADQVVQTESSAALQFFIELEIVTVRVRGA